ncbi:MAG: hypothetical protein AseanaTS_15490 [Candidatus Pelagadaptatus aseana]|uniref:hypothetical protein n=1 Tax=Candidatus Pelagadaptatus aseana TaxID=3120508 RepID=UPI0039B34C49
MSHVVRIPHEIYSRLEKHAQGFDTPANVIERLLNHYEGLPDNSAKKGKEPLKSGRDTTKYNFNSHTYGKGRLVLAVIKQYVLDNPEITEIELLSAFPKSLQGSIGVFNELQVVVDKYENKNHKRHFIKDGEIIELSDTTIAVSTEWGEGNISNFIDQAEKYGYSIRPENI